MLREEVLWEWKQMKSKLVANRGIITTIKTRVNTCVSKYYNVSRECSDDLAYIHNLLYRLK